MTVRVRFAPSPTGNVHIGNIRAAIFNWLFARHERGEFLLRIEDTDRERSTPEAIANLFRVMEWLDLSYDQPPLYQSSQLDHHLRTVEQLIQKGAAYRFAKDGGQNEAVLFRIPWQTEAMPELSTTGQVVEDIHPETPVTIDASGINYAHVSQKGKPVPQASCFAGMPDLEILDAQGGTVFRLQDELEDILAGTRRLVEIKGGVSIRFTRRLITFPDLIKGTLAKPLDSLRDFVIVRGDGSPVFHLANVCDDVTQKITHIIRGDDHVENTYRHIFIFHALGVTPPHYAHLPMIVNDQGKPYSKRDGDAYVGDFQDKGYLPETLFNYLTLLGWSTGDDREKLSRQELIAAFSLDRVQSSPARMDLKKLENLNGKYIAEMPPPEFLDRVRTFCPKLWTQTDEHSDYFNRVATMMQSRTKRLTDIESWQHFFVTLPEFDEKAAAKFLTKPEIKHALNLLITLLQETPFAPETLEQIIHDVTAKLDIPEGKLNQPLRVALTGITVGAGIYETMALLGRDKVLARLQLARDNYCHE